MKKYGVSLLLFCLLILGVVLVMSIHYPEMQARVSGEVSTAWGRVQAFGKHLAEAIQLVFSKSA